MRRVHRHAALVEFLAIEAVEALEERGVVRAHLAGRHEHLVEKGAGLVGIEHGHESAS